jgi:hypothetical protein
LRLDVGIGRWNSELDFTFMNAVVWMSKNS